MAELFEVLLVDGDQRWRAGFLVDDETETDVLLGDDDGKVLLFGTRAHLEHLAQENGLELHDDLPDEIDLDLGGWLVSGAPQPDLAEVSALWHLVVDDPDASRPLHSEVLEEAYDDLVTATAVDAPPGAADAWFAEHGGRARAALAQAVQRLRASFRQA